MILLCRLISIFSFLLLLAFGAVASFATPGDWQQFSYSIEARDLVAQQVNLTNTARAPPTTSADVMTTGTAFAQTGNLRALDGVETTGAVYAFLLPAIAPNRVVPDGWRPVTGVGAQVSTPRGFTTYRTPDGDLVHVSPGGLQYGADPKFGNRVDHVLDHTAPNLNKSVHSVFNVQGDDALNLVDEAWSNRSGAGTLQANGNRTWTVDLGRPVGTIGQTSVQIVVRDGTNELITAFPK